MQHIPSNFNFLNAKFYCFFLNSFIVVYISFYCVFITTRRCVEKQNWTASYTRISQASEPKVHSYTHKNRKDKIFNANKTFISMCFVVKRERERELRLGKVRDKSHHQPPRTTATTTIIMVIIINSSSILIISIL